MSWEPCPGHGCPRPSDWFVRGRRLSHSVGHRCPGNHALDMDVHGHRNQPVDDLRDEKRVPEYRDSHWGDCFGIAAPLCYRRSEGYRPEDIDVLGTMPWTWMSTAIGINLSTISGTRSVSRSIGNPPSVGDLRSGSCGVGDPRTALPGSRTPALSRSGERGLSKLYTLNRQPLPPYCSVCVCAERRV
jgi:hypothetical protein